MEGTDQAYGFKLGPAAKLDVPKLKLDWYRWVFGLGERPALLDARIKYYVSGPQEWRSADSFQDIPDSVSPLFLSSDGPAFVVYRSGWLTDAPQDTPADTFVSDPFDLRPLETERHRSNPRS